MPAHAAGPRWCPSGRPAACWASHSLNCSRGYSTVCLRPRPIRMQGIGPRGEDCSQRVRALMPISRAASRALRVKGVSCSGGIMSLHWQARLDMRSVYQERAGCQIRTSSHGQSRTKGFWGRDAIERSQQTGCHRDNPWGGGLSRWGPARGENRPARLGDGLGGGGDCRFRCLGWAEHSRGVFFCLPPPNVRRRGISRPGAKLPRPPRQREFCLSFEARIRRVSWASVDVDGGSLTRLDGITPGCARAQPETGWMPPRRHRPGADHCSA